MALVNDPDIWDDSQQGSLAETIRDQIKKMPDRPKVVVAVFNWKEQLRPQFASEISKFGNALLSKFGLIYFNQPIEVAFLGFYGGTDDLDVCRFFEIVRELPVDEAVVYIDGHSKFRIAPTKKREQEQAF